MKKRLLSLVLCLVMVFSLFPMAALASTKENAATDGEYFYEAAGTGWKTTSDYGTEQLYAYVDKDGDGTSEYVPVDPVTFNTYSKIPNTSGWTAESANQTYNDNPRTDKNVYYKVSDTQYDIVYMDYAQYYRNAGTISANKFVNSATGSDWNRITNNSSLKDDYYYTPTIAQIATVEPFWHRVYANTTGRTWLSSGGKYVDLWYYTGGETSMADGTVIAEFRPAALDVISKYTEQYRNALHDVLVAEIPAVNDKNYKDDNHGTFHAWCNSYNTTQRDYIGGLLYVRMDNNNQRFNVMYTDPDASKKTLAWPLTQENVNSSEVPSSSTYTGDLYYHDQGVSKLVYKDGGAILAGSVEKTGYDETIYSGTLFTRSNEKLGKLDGEKNLTDNGDGTYTLTIDSWATGNYQAYEEVGATPVAPAEKTPLDIVLVLDQSGSMRTADLEGGEIRYEPVMNGSEVKTGWTIPELRNGTQYYYKDEATGKYYPVQLGRGNIYYKYGSRRGNETFGWGNDGISLLVNGAPTYYNVRTNYFVYVDADGDDYKEMHRVRAITAGLDLHYGFYPYIYKDENNEYAQMGKWTDNHYWFRLISPWGANKLRNNARWNTIINQDLISFLDTNENLLGSSDAACNSAKMNYSWITDTARMNDLYRVNAYGFTNMYYVDDAGVRHNFGSTRFFRDDNFDTRGAALYTVTGGTTRVAALENAVNQFVNIVKADATEEGNPVDHKIAIVGYAQNANAAATPVASDARVIGSNGTNTYTNTGVFTNNYSNFTNYNNSPAYGSAFVSAADISKDFTDTFGTWGGTYLAYGMDMAKQVLDNGRANAKKVVIVFTDGEPGESGYESEAAAEALARGANVKGLDNVEIYTVGLYPQSADTQAELFLQQLSSDYRTLLQPVTAAAMQYDKTYIHEANGVYTAISTDYYGESSLGWWENNGDGTFTLLSIKGKNAGAGEEYLYTDRNKGGETSGEDADTSKTYYSERGNEVKYEYHWFDSNMNVVVPTGNIYEIQQDRLSGKYSTTVSTRAGLEEIFKTLAAEIGKDENAAPQQLTPGATVNATNYDGSNSIIRDVISGDFNLQGAKVTLQYVSASDDGTGITEGTASAAPSTITYQLTGKEITVSGFDFGENSIYAGHPGSKLRVIITGLVPTTTGTVFSNVETKSGIYEYTENTFGDKLFSYNNPSTEVPTYTVQWSVNGQVVETDADLMRNAVPSYDGATPEKPDDTVNNKTYTFVGWSAVSATDVDGAKPVYELPLVTADVTYYAVFREAAIQTYTVHWMNGSDEVKTTEVLAGQHPAFSGTEPTAEGKIFIGWAKTDDYDYLTDGDAGMYFGVETVEQLAQGASTDVYLYAAYVDEEEVPVTQHQKAVVLEYNTVQQIASGVYDYLQVSEKSGKFALSEGSFTFTPNTAKTDSTNYDYRAMKDVSTAVYYEKNAEHPDKITDATTVNVVPGSSVYFDDDLTGKTGNASTAYSAALDSADEELDPNDGKLPVYFTFTGTGIDVYSSTLKNGDYIQTALFRINDDGTQTVVKTTDDGKVADDGVSTKLIKVYSAANRYNVPTVAYRELPYGTYKVKINVFKDSHYVLDGVRVYGAVDSKDQNEVYKDDAANEKNASFTNLRGLLLTNTATLNGGVGYFTDMNESYTIKDQDGKETKIEKYTLEAYKKDGPKNEIYLQAGQGIAFTITNYKQLKEANGGNAPLIQVGLSAPNEDYTSGTVTLSNGTGTPKQETVSALDMYYTVVPTENGDGTANVMITCDSTNDAKALISVTNLKVSGTSSPIKVQIDKPAAAGVMSVNASAPEQVMRIAVNQKTLDYAESFLAVKQTAEEDPQTPDTPATPDEPDSPKPGWNTGSNTIQQLLKDVFKVLFKSLSGLFNGLPKW